jgi:high-affinity iron transporter
MTGGIVLSIILGIAFMAAFYSARSVVFSGPDQYIFEGVVTMVACVMLTSVSFALLRMLSMQKKWEERLTVSTQKQDLMGTNKYALAILSFSAVFREGVETVILITGISQGNPESLPIPGIIGIFIGVVFGYFVCFTSRPINLKYFMIINSAIMFALGAGLFIYSIHEFQEADLFGPWKGVPYAYRPWQNQYIADFSKCCSSDKPSTDGSGKRKPTFFTLMRALFGYQAKPTRLEIIMYCGYWFLVISGLTYKVVKGTIWGVQAKAEVEDEAAAAAEAAALKLKGGDAEAGDADGTAPEQGGEGAELPDSAPVAKEEKEVLFSSLLARILLRLVAACTKPEVAQERAPLAGVAVEDVAAEGDAAAIEAADADAAAPAPASGDAVVA